MLILILRIRLPAASTSPSRRPERMRGPWASGARRLHQKVHSMQMPRRHARGTTSERMSTSPSASIDARPAPTRSTGAKRSGLLFTTVRRLLLSLHHPFRTPSRLCPRHRPRHRPCRHSLLAAAASTSPSRRPERMRGPWASGARRLHQKVHSMQMPRRHARGTTSERMSTSPSASIDARPAPTRSTGAKRSGLLFTTVRRLLLSLHHPFRTPSRLCQHQRRHRWRPWSK